MRSRPVTEIGGLPIPVLLLRLVSEGRWRPPEDAELISRVFHDEPDWPNFYNVRQMRLQNQSFQTWSRAPAYVQPSDDSLEIIPQQAVLVGDLGADMPIALDYQLDHDHPRVVYLGPRGWIEIAPDIETLCRLLDL